MVVENSTDETVLLPRQIKLLLKKHKVSLKLWGTNTWRSFDDLVTYHKKCRLFFRRDGDKLIIDVHAAVVIIVHCFRSRWLELYEDRQVFTDGSILSRARNFNGIAETIERMETPQEAALRCLKEEVAFVTPSGFELSECLAVEHRESVSSEKWPGIWASYHRYLFECTITRKLFRKDGYVEREGDRLIYFKCFELRNSSTSSFSAHTKHPQSSAVLDKSLFLLQSNLLAKHIRKQ